MPECIRESTVTTRKPCHYFACGRKFPVGSRMAKWVNVEGGHIYTTSVCPTCNEILSNHGEAYGDPFGDGFEEGCVGDRCFDVMTDEKITPEQLLEKIKQESKLIQYGIEI